MKNSSTKLHRRIIEGRTRTIFLWLDSEDEAPGGSLAARAEDQTSSFNEPEMHPLGVLLSNGEYILNVTDLVIPGRGLDLTFTRTYRNAEKSFRFHSKLGSRLTFHANYQSMGNFHRWFSPEGLVFGKSVPEVGKFRRDPTTRRRCWKSGSLMEQCAGFGESRR